MTEQGPVGRAVLPEKKPYMKPELNKLGTIRELTQGGQSAGQDVPGKKVRAG